MFFGPGSTRTTMLSCIAVQNYEDLILGKNRDFYRHFLVTTIIIRGFPNIVSNILNL